MAEAQFEHDELLKLLTEALRSGPGSPQWHDAVGRLRQMQLGSGEANEYKLLMAVREDLESGREYRSIRPGPGFTKKVMESIEQAATKRPGLSLANVIAVLSAVVVIGVLVWLGFWISRSGGPSIENLETMQCTRPLAGGDFSGSIGGDWKTFGVAPVISQKSLRAGYRKESEREGMSGGLYLAHAIPADQPFAIEAKVRIAKRASPVNVEFLITQSPLGEGKSPSAGDLVVTVSNGQVSVFTSGTLPAGSTYTLPEGKSELSLLVKLDGKFVIVKCDEKELYAGPNGLAADKPRWPGVRFVAKGPEKPLDDVTVQSMQILKP